MSDNLPSTAAWRAWVAQATTRYPTRSEGEALLSSWNRRAQVAFDAWRTSPLSLQGMIERARYRELQDAARTLEARLGDLD